MIPVIQCKLNDSEVFGKGNKGNVKSMLATSVTRLDTNVESMFSSISFVQLDALSVIRLDAEVELTLSIVSFTRIDTASITRLDINIESIYLSNFRR